jgi:hypothetical protein
MHKQKLSTQELQQHTTQLWAFGPNFGLGSLPARIGHHQDKNCLSNSSHEIPFKYLKFHYYPFKSFKSQTKSV